MGKARDLVRPILFIIGGVFVLQVPLFIGILKLVQLRGHEHHLISTTAIAGRTLLLGSLNSWSGADAAPGETRISSDVPAFKPLSVAHYPFVLFNIYRYSLNTIYLLGTTSVVVRAFENDLPVYRCEWIPANKSNDNGSNGAEQTSQVDQQQQQGLVTEAKMHYVRFDENRMAYVPAIVNCTFNQSVGADGEGGLLRLYLSQGPTFWPPYDGVVDVFREKPGEVNEKSKPWLRQDYTSESESLVVSTLPYKYAFCGPPLYGTSHNQDWIPKWLAYHHHLWEGKAHFYFYIAEELGTAARQMLEPWTNAGLLTIIEAAEGEAYPAWYRNQLLFINDCIYRTRFTAQWAFFHDLDELIYVPAPNTLASLLEEHHDKPWLTFGNLPFSISLCRRPQQQNQSSDEDGNQEWQLERLLWRNKQPECMHADKDPWMCIAAPGRRKYMVNPRKVFLSGVHRVAMPEEGGVNFNATVARVHHFHGITNPRTEACNTLVSMSSDADQPDPNEYDLDDAVASIMPQVRQFAGSLVLPP